MRWRLVDKVTRLEAWKAIEGIKTVSLEEYALYEPLGSPGILPASLILESCSQLAGWLIWSSSDGKFVTLLDEVSGVEFVQFDAMGVVLHLCVSVVQRSELGASVRCAVKSEGNEVAGGVLGLRFLCASEAYSPEQASGIWREIVATT